jgi:hypothetical protein
MTAIPSENSTGKTKPYAMSGPYPILTNGIQKHPTKMRTAIKKNLIGTTTPMEFPSLLLNASPMRP